MNADLGGVAEHSSSYLELECFADRIRELVGEFGSANALRKAAGLSQSGFTRYLKGGEATRPALIAIANAANVNLLWLMTGQPPKRGVTAWPERFGDEYAQVPIYNVSVSAGDGALVEHEEAVGRLAFGRWWLRQAGLQEQHLAAIRATGDSMEPTISDGDMLLVDTNQRDIRADAVFVVRLDDMLVVKRVQRLPGQQVRILSDNRRYDPIQLGASDLAVAGRVVWVGHSL